MQAKTITFVSSHLLKSDAGGMGIVAVLRRRGAGRFEMGVFLVDPACLGVKNAWFEELEEHEVAERKEHLFQTGCAEKDAPWGRKFVEGAVEYARQLGFKPHPEYKKAARVFGGIKTADCPETFTYGYKGKPFYVQGENESPQTADRIVRRLRALCGEDGFHYALAVTEDALEDRVDYLLERAEKGEHDFAERELTELLEKNPESALAHYGVGMVETLKANGNQSVVLKHLLEALRIEPDFGRAWYNLGVAYKKLLRIPPMAFAFIKAVQHAEPDDPLVKSAQEMIDFTAKQAREDFGLDLDTYVESGMIFESAFDKLEEGNWSEAAEAFRQVIELNPRSNQAWGNLGVCFLQMGRFNEAREAWNKALRVKPDYALAQENLKRLDEQANNPGSEPESLAGER